MHRLTVALCLLPALLWAGGSSLVKRRPQGFTPAPSHKTAGFGVHASNPAKKPLVRNLGAATAPGQRLACTPTVTLTPGVAYHGDTTGQTNKFDTTDYPTLGWDEYGPDVVHQVSVAKTCDLRIHIEPDPTTTPDLDVILLDSAGSCDTTNWIYAGDDTIIYPDCPPGTYYIIVDGYSASDEGQYTLWAAAATGLLLVDDDGSGDPSQCTSGCPDVQSYYTDAINNMSTPPSTVLWDYALLGTPDEATINNAKYILWFCGGAYDTGETVTSTDEELLKSYLALGGRLMMVGQDILFDVMGGNDGRLPDGSLFNDYMQVNEVYQDVWTSGSVTIDGVVGNPISDLLNCNDAAYYFDQVTTTNGAPFSAYSDSLVTRYGDPVYYNNYINGNTGSQKPAAIRYESSLGISDYYKTLFAAFAPECDDPANVLVDMTAFIENTFSWFDTDDETLCPYDNNLTRVIDVTGYFDDSTTGNNNGIPDPNETFNFIVRVTNNDTVAHSFKVYEGFEDYYVTRYSPLCVDLGSIAAGSYAEATFQLKLIGDTPIGYRVRPEYNIIKYDTGTEEFCFRQGFGAFVDYADVLLVKDEYLYPNTTGVDVYSSLLTTLGYTYALWDTALFASPTYNTLGLDNDRMINYDFVIWFTGFDYYYTLTPDPYDQDLGINPETELKTFLNLRKTDTGYPARLILSSQDYLFDKYDGQDTTIPTTDFAYTHLKVSRVYQDYLKDATTTIHGIEGTFSTEKMAPGLQNNGPNGDTFPNYADQILINQDEAGTKTLWAFLTEPVQILSSVVNVDKTRAARFAFMPFAFENVQDAPAPSTKQTFLDRLMCEMMMTLSDPYPPCAYYLPVSQPEFDTLRAVKGTEDETLLTWGSVTFTNTNGDPISGRYRVRRGDCSTLTSGPFDLPIWTTTANESAPPDSAVPPAGTAYCYNVIDYVDDFDQSADINTPPLP